MRVFKIKNVNDLFDDLLVHVESNSFEENENCLVPISRIQKKHDLFEAFSLPVDEESVYIKFSHLEPYEDKTGDIETDNPYGDFLNNGIFFNEKYKVSYALFKNALTVRVEEEDTEQILYSHSFIGKDKFDIIWPYLTNAMASSDFDWDDVLFFLKGNE